MQPIYTRRRMLALLGGSALAGAGIFASGRAPGAVALTVAPEAASPVPGAPGDKLLLQITIAGGFVPAEFNLTLLPFVSLYADGRVIAAGPMIEIYPSPALPNLRQTVITADGIATVLDRAQAAGIFDGPAQYDGPPVSDLPYTTFTVYENGVPTEVSAYALGFDESMLPDTADAEARAKLIEFQSFVADLPNQLPAEQVVTTDEEYEIEKIKVYARPIDPDNPPGSESGLEQPEKEWPLAEPISAFAAMGEEVFADTLCGAFTGDNAAKLVEALKDANQLTPFTSDGVAYQLWVRPLLPHEPANCS